MAAVASVPAASTDGRVLELYLWPNTMFHCVCISMNPGACAGAGAEARVVPADMLLLAGTCIVEEAVLTGESHPQWKTPVGNLGAGPGEAWPISDACMRQQVHCQT